MGTLNYKVDLRTYMRVPPEKAYDGLTKPEILNQWFTTQSEIDLQPAGRLYFRWDNWGGDGYTGDNLGKVLEARRPERFSFSWKADSGGYDTVVEIDITPHAWGCMVHLTEDGYEDSPVGMQDLMNRQAGWGEVLTMLKFFLEHGVTY